MTSTGAPTATSIAADLTSDWLVVTWSVDGDLRDATYETYLLSLWVPRPGQGDVQLGAKLFANGEAAVFAFDHTLARQLNAEDPHAAITLAASTITVHFPAEWAQGARQGQAVRSTLTVDGGDRVELVADLDVDA